MYGGCALVSVRAERVSNLYGMQYTKDPMRRH